MQHTPGPWFRNINAKYPVYAGPKGKHTHVASILSGPEYREGDLRLIAAAPELLAALRLADTILDGMGPLYASGHGAQQIRAAIAKAEGGAP